MDETTVHCWNYSGKIWQRKDDPLIYQLPQYRGKGQTIYGVISSKNTKHLFEWGATTNTVELGLFLISVDQKIGLKDKILVLDNHSAHTSQDTKEFLKSRGCTALYLPPRASEMNPIGKIFCF